LDGTGLAKLASARKHSGAGRPILADFIRAMGDVYKAREKRLDRTVAVKVLPDHIAQRDDLRARFEREAPWPR